MKENILKTKSYSFALKIVRACMEMKREHKEFDMTRQLLRSGTAVGALIREAEYGQSRADFVHKLSISLKEANETDYWISLLKDSQLMTLDIYNILKDECTQLIKLLTLIANHHKIIHSMIIHYSLKD